MWLSFPLNSQALTFCIFVLRVSDIAFPPPKTAYLCLTVIFFLLILTNVSPWIQKALEKMPKTDSISEGSQVTAAVFARILLYIMLLFVLQRNFLKYSQTYCLFFFQIPCHHFSLKGEMVSLLSYFLLVLHTLMSTYCLLLHLDYTYFMK